MSNNRSYAVNHKRPFDQIWLMPPSLDDRGRWVTWNLQAGNDRAEAMLLWSDPALWRISDHPPPLHPVAIGTASPPGAIQQASLTTGLRVFEPRIDGGAGGSEGLPHSTTVMARASGIDTSFGDLRSNGLVSRSAPAKMRWHGAVPQHVASAVTLTVDPGSVLEIAGAVPTSETIQFASGGYGTLKLDAPALMNGTISGFTGTAALVGQSDVIDLVGVGTLSSSNLSYSTATNILTVTNNFGATVASLRFTGTYVGTSFKTAPDGAGGTNILDPSNPIVLENEKTGTPMSIWAINGNINNQGNDAAIEGFATSMSIDPGQTENFKINTGSTDYRIDIYRLGYYGGDGARLISSQTNNLASPQVQPAALFNSSTNEVDAGNWAVSASWTVPTDAVSGVYFAKLTTLNGTIGQNMIPFVVTSGGAAAPITFQTSDSTWQAYNSWGGYNLYAGPGGRSDRAYAVSYNRPIDMNSTANYAGPQDFLFGEEYSAIYWLEQNGYNVRYVTSGDVANNPSALANTQIYMDVGHDEYWSMSQYNNVQAAANAGVNLAFLSGNQVYWDVSYANGLDGSSNTTIVQYKDLWSGSQIDPNGTSGGGTSTFRDPTYGPGLPENSLTGNIFQVDGSSQLLDVQVPYSLSQFQFWQNTSVASLAPGGVATLSNLLGYEWNTDNNNGFRPAGLVDLSSTTAYVGSLLLDYGVNDGSGNATHSLTLYRDQTSGALIFNAGTVMWSWGLDTQHALYNGQTAPASEPVQQSLVNLFADMGVQPQTLMASLMYATASTDRTPPVSQITTIGSGQALYSNEAVTISGTATDSGGSKVAMVEVSTDGGKTWNRATGFNNWTYSWIVPVAGTYTVETRATDGMANLETPSDATSVTVSAGSTDSLFTSSPGDVIPYSTVSSNLNSGDPGPVELGIRFSTSTSGTIDGVRFYKGVNDTGPNVCSLWSSNGTLLASGTPSNETASGWQTVDFSTPVAISAGTTYVAGYLSNGYYPVDSNYFTAPFQNGPLTAVESGVGPSVYTYSSSSVFPTSSGNDCNYWVDALFTPSTTTNQIPVATNDSGFIAYENTALAIAASTLLANDTDPDGDTLTVTGVSNPVDGTVALNTTTNTITFTPSTGYTGPASFTYTISDGRGGTASANVALNVSASSPPISLWSTSTTPAEMSANDPNPVELGVKFTVSTSGTISGLRYYKSANDTGTHVGSLWTSSGTLLASATFTNETTSGWQTVDFSTPVAITAGTTYVAGYHSNGDYADNSNYFTSAYTNGPLTALASGTSGGNGVYTYSSSSVFPTSTWNASNYWVDVLFTPSTTTNQIPVATNDSGFIAYENTALAIAASTLLANDTDPDGDTLTVTGVSNPVDGTVALNTTTNTITFTPTTGYTGPANFTYTISDGRGGTASANVALNVSASSPPVSLWSTSTTPAQTSSNDPNPVELGVKFTVSTSGTISGLRYYKSANDTGTHIGSLWTSSGTLLASATFTNETTSGWQTVDFSTPVAITAGTTYVAGYHSNGDYADNSNYFTSAYTNGPLTALASGTSGGNGVYTYSSSSVFPTSTWNASNYWVDVLFQSSTTTTNSPPVANNDTGYVAFQSTPLVIEASQLLANDTDSSGLALSVTGVSSPANGTVSFNASTNLITFTPAAGYSGPASFTYSIADSAGGTASANVDLTVASSSSLTSSTLFSPTSVPGTVTVNDPNPVELGVKFTATTAGTITGMQFYKGPQNTGVHTGELWSLNGTLLATGTFTNETASGWQSLTFPQAVAIAAGETDIVSYHTNTGFYSADNNYFTTAHTSGALTAPSSSSSGGNGVYAYGGTTSFPTNTYAASNYWVDVTLKT